MREVTFDEKTGRRIARATVRVERTPIRMPVGPRSHAGARTAHSVSARIIGPYDDVYQRFPAKIMYHLIDGETTTTTSTPPPTTTTTQAGETGLLDCPKWAKFFETHQDSWLYMMPVHADAMSIGDIILALVVDQEEESQGGLSILLFSYTCEDVDGTDPTTTTTPCPINTPCAEGIGCDWIWNPATRTWILISGDCPDCCVCAMPNFCPTEEDEDANPCPVTIHTHCLRRGDELDDVICTTTTTTTTTTPPPRCIGFCRYACIGGFRALITDDCVAIGTTCSCPDYSAVPCDPCIDAGFITDVCEPDDTTTTPPPTTTTTPAPTTTTTQIGGCEGNCIWQCQRIVCTPLTGWVPISSNCFGEDDCGCGQAPGVFGTLGQLITTQCVPGGTTTTTTTTTPAPTTTTTPLYTLYWCIDVDCNGTVSCYQRLPNPGECVISGPWTSGTTCLLQCQTMTTTTTTVGPTTTTTEVE